VRIGLCTPAYKGTVSDAYATAMARTMVEAAARGIEIVEIKGRGMPVIHHARNWCVAQAFELGCDKVWFVDDDIAWKDCVPEALNMLRAPVDIVAGVHQGRNTFWNDPARLVVQWDKLPPEEDPETGLWKVKKVATAFVCIDRSVFERIDAAGLARPYLSFGDFGTGHAPEPYMRHMRAYFDFAYIAPSNLSPEMEKQVRSIGYTGPIEILQGEDYAFCDKARKAGCSIYVDPRIALTHFDGCVQHNVSLKDVSFVDATQADEPAEDSRLAAVA